MARDLAVALALVLFGLIALEVHDASTSSPCSATVSSLPGTALAAASTAAADGGELGDALRGAGEGSGGEVRDLGAAAGAARPRRPARDSLLRAACGCSCSGRCRRGSGRVRRLKRGGEGRWRAHAGRRPAGDAGGVRNPRRAAGSRRDPLGDLEAERYDALVAAELDRADLQPRRRLRVRILSSASTSWPPGRPDRLLAGGGRRAPTRARSGSSRAGLAVEVDAVGNRSGRFPAASARSGPAPTSTPSPARGDSTGRSASSRGSRRSSGSACRARRRRLPRRGARLCGLSRLQGAA